MSDIFKVKQNNSWVGIPALVGAQGPKGDKGDTGETGPRGLQGIQGEVGPQGPQGIQGIQGETGVSAGFGTPTASAAGLPVGSNPTVSISSSGPDTAKVFSFNFGIPESGVSQADWNETDTEDDSYIRNKPNLNDYKPFYKQFNNVSSISLSSDFAVNRLVIYDLRRTSSTSSALRFTFGTNLQGHYVIWTLSGYPYDGSAGSEVSISLGTYTKTMIMMMRVS